MTDNIEALAQELYEACQTVKPRWDQLGEVTKSVWREYAAHDLQLEEEYAMSGKITIKTIQERLGVPITGTFVTDTLGIQPVEKEARSVFWAESQYGEICEKLIGHIESKKGSTAMAVKPPPKDKKNEASSEDGFDFGGGASETGGAGFDFGGEAKAEGDGFDFGGEEKKEEPVGFDFG